ncbi:MAG: dihydroorotase [Candidatus Kapaibacterium sp.]|nr:MAG: dihydroorotase [Candidatus Kapabacteria bacterium]
MAMDLLFERIRIVSPLDKLDSVGYLWVQHGSIVHCSTEPPANIPPTTCRIAADDWMAAPGFVDMHVHLREPGQTHKETIATGSAAAANGGFTDIVCMPNTEPPIDTPTVIEYIQRRATGLVAVHVCAAISVGRHGEVLTPMEHLHEAGAVMFSDDGSCVRSAELMRRAFEYAAPFDALLSQHCEEHSMTDRFDINEGAIAMRLGLRGYPSVAEDIIIARDILLAEYCGNRRYHVSHMSTRGAVRLVRLAKSWGLRVSAEVTPHHFTLTEDAADGFNTNAKMNPPLRCRHDVEAILEGLADGTIDAIATDHAPHAPSEKAQLFAQAPNGIIGLETAVGLALTELYHKRKFPLTRIVELMSVAPRRILQLPQPRIAVGEPAVLTIVALEQEWTVEPERFRSKSRNTPFGGWLLQGKPRFAINRGQVWECEL